MASKPWMTHDNIMAVWDVINCQEVDNSNSANKSQQFDSSEAKGFILQFVVVQDQIPFG